ncbi:MAG TPA: M1 family metallopeptidase, partial [Candidatus Sulfotelmatobacter sp.]|nr:M1 family metallopeptidase [Candidatus Sulfotelmatobacter sp.]
LVTMAWWNGLWLNEAFATFMEVLAVDAWRPAWERWTSFGVSRAAALLVDGLASTRPVEYEVKAPKDADAMFDVLTYEKGGAVLRMLEQYLGPGVFRDGVRGYLARHRFGSADTIDLWRALGRAADQPIPELMDGWIFRSGYPLLRVALEPGGEGLRVSQERFRYLPLPHEEAQQRWQIPLRLRVGSAGGGSQTISRLLVEEEERIPLPGPADWVAVNADGHGFYRVRYAPDLRARLLTAGGLQAIERFNLLSDAWALALAGRERAGEFLDVTEHFREELDRNVWSAILAPFAYLARVIAPGLQPGLAALVRDRVGLAVERLGWLPGKGETELTRQLRGELLRAAGILGEDPAVQARAKAVLAEASGQPAAVEPAVLSAAIAVAAHVGGSGEYADFLERFKSAGTPQDEQRFLYALAGFREPSLVQQTLTLSIDGTVRTQDAPLLVRSLLLGVHSREAAWAFVKAHWDTMEARFPSQGGLRRMLEGITGLATRALESDVLGFLAARKVVLGGKTLEQYLEQLHIAVLFGEREAKSLHRHLGGPEA